MPIFRCAFEGTAASQLIVNVFHLYSATSDAQTIAQGFEAYALDDWLACLSTSYTASQIVVTDLSTLEQWTEGLTGSGVQTGDMLPPQAAAVLSWKTGLAGRKYRGRTYVGTLAEGDQTLGTLSSGAQARLETLGVVLRSTYPSAVNSAFHIYHRATNTSTPVTSHVVRAVVYTQRRRTVGQGS